MDIWVLKYIIIHLFLLKSIRVYIVIFVCMCVGEVCRYDVFMTENMFIIIRRV